MKAQINLELYHLYSVGKYMELLLDRIRVRARSHASSSVFEYLYDSIEIEGRFEHTALFTFQSTRMYRFEHTSAPPPCPVARNCISLTRRLS